MVSKFSYELSDPSAIGTPCLLVYPDLIRANLRESLRIAGTGDRLRLHVKTYKTPQIVRMALEFGIHKHKCATLSEARMLAECEVPDVLVAYPQVGPNPRRLFEFVEQFPNTRFSTVVDSAACLEQLDKAFQAAPQPLDVYLDIDTGMHRTGVVPGSQAAELYRRMADSQSLRPAGLHVYDGQNHQPDLAERQSAVAALLTPVMELVSELRRQGADVPKMICGGTPTFPVFAAADLRSEDVAVECSPGTCVLSDFNYGRDYADLAGIQPAAVLMTRVISRPTPETATVDLGYKAVASDSPAGRRCYFLNLPDTREVMHSEEHLVIAGPNVERLSIGDVLYVVPAHICPTVALHSHLLAVEDGCVQHFWPVQARDRIY